MNKQVVTKDDGRKLILYSFGPSKKTQTPDEGETAQ
jgi:hypothetical protein